MDRADIKPTSSRQETRELVSAVLTDVDGRPQFLSGAAKLAPLPWIRESVDHRKYKKALVDAEDQALKLGLRDHERESAHQLVTAIHQVWKELESTSEGRVDPSEIRQLLLDRQILREAIKPEVIAERPRPGEPMTNPCPVFYGRGRGRGSYT